MRQELYIGSVFAVLVSLCASIQGLQFGQICDAAPFYSSGTWEYLDSCEDVYLFCDPTTNTCNYKGCANSDYISGWNISTRPLPPRCPAGTYCPDNNSKCDSLIAPGGHCEMERDDECLGANTICLNATCFIKGAPLTGHCGADQTDYVSYDAEGNPVQQTIIRDNCTIGTYCDIAQTFTCVSAKANGNPCTQDRECLSETCGLDDVCANGPDVFHQIPAWLWGVIGLAVFLFVLLNLGVLWLLQRYQARKEHEKIVKFFTDNDEFEKYALTDDGDFEYPQQSSRNASTIFLTTPNAEESSRLSRMSMANNSSTPALQKYRMSTATIPDRQSYHQ